MNDVDETSASYLHLFFVTKKVVGGVPFSFSRLFFLVPEDYRVVIFQFDE